MSRGLYISGAAHAGLIGWLILGWGLAADPMEFDVTEVTMISADAFDQALAAGQPDAVSEVETPQSLPMPAVRPEPAPEPEQPAPAEQPAEVTPPPPDPAPEPVPPTPPVESVEVTPPDAPVAPVAAPEVNVDDQRVERPKPRPSDRIAPVTVSPPEEDAAVSDVQQAPTTPSEPTPDPAPTQETAAPEAASEEIVTEAEKPAGQSTRAVIPARRPANLVPEAPAEPAEQPAEQPSEPTSDPVADALAAALAAEPAQSQGQQGQALTQGELGSFLGQVAACWNMGSASTDAQLTKVVLGFELLQDGRLKPGSIKRMGHTGGDAAAADIAYRAAERALTQCETNAGRSGYSLPPEKYDQWSQVELRFDPETMRLR